MSNFIDLINEYTILGLVGLLVPVALMIFATKILKKHSSDLQDELRSHKETSNQTMSKTLLELISSVRPRIVYCPDTPALTDECVAMINQAVDDFRQHRKLIEENGDQNVDEQKKETISFINIYGAANIEKSSEPDVEDSHEKFHSSLDLAMQSGLRVQRYINLPPSDVFETSSESNKIERSKAKKVEYFEWISHEIEIIKKSSNYDLILNPRAPGWEGAATMATNSGIVEIKGGGKSGLAIYDSALSASIRFSVRRDLQGASDKNKIIINSHKNLHLLEAIRDGMEKLL